MDTDFFPENSNFYPVIRQFLDQKLQCGICGIRVFGDQSALDQHVVESHTGENTVDVKHEFQSGPRNLITASIRIRDKDQQTLDPAVIRRVQLMNQSLPARVRYTGGVFTAGPLSGSSSAHVPGLPRYFGTSGRLKAAYFWITHMSNPDEANLQSAGPTPALTPTPEINPKDSFTFQKPPPFTNECWREWSKDDTTRPYTTIKTNLFSPGRWPEWDEKVDPTWIAPSLKQCDGCDKNVCNCIETLVRQEVPDVIDAGVFGEGLVSTANYNPGDIIAELLGEIVPPDEYEDNMAGDIYRTDLSEAGPSNGYVCQVYTRYVGNWSRKINHSCDGGAIFQNIRLSGKWRMVFKATRQIKKGEPLTIHYGPYFWKGKEDQCQCGSDNCVSKTVKGKGKAKSKTKSK